jgi:antirestriction protein
MQIEAYIDGKWVEVKEDIDDMDGYTRDSVVNGTDPYPNMGDNLPDLCAIKVTLNEVHDADAYAAYADLVGWDWASVERFEDAYAGEWKDEEAFAQNMVDECYELEGPLAMYFDIEAFTRDLFMCDHSYHHGYVFRDC